MSSDATERFAAAASDADSSDRLYLLRLYVVGASPAAQRAILNLERICEQTLKGRYTLEVVDVRQHPVLAADEQIVATPTVIKVLPAPMARLIGDLSDTERVLLGLDLVPQAG